MVAINKVTLVKAPDWQCLYVNDKLEMQYHRIDLEDALPVLLRLGVIKNMAFEVKEVDYKWYNNPNSTFPPAEFNQIKFQNN